MAKERRCCHSHEGTVGSDRKGNEAACSAYATEALPDVSSQRATTCNDCGGAARVRCFDVAPPLSPRTWRCHGGCRGHGHHGIELCGPTFRLASSRSAQREPTHYTFWAKRQNSRKVSTAVLLVESATCPEKVAVRPWSRRSCRALAYRQTSFFTRVGLDLRICCV